MTRQPDDPGPLISGDEETYGNLDGYEGDPSKIIAWVLFALVVAFTGASFGAVIFLRS